MTIKSSEFDRVMLNLFQHLPVVRQTPKQVRSDFRIDVLAAVHLSLKHLVPLLL